MANIVGDNLTIRPITERPLWKPTGLKQTTIVENLISNKKISISCRPKRGWVHAEILLDSSLNFERTVDVTK
jgi:hypothetical protein